MTTLMGCHFLSQPIVEPKHYRTYIQYVVFYPGYKDTVSTYTDDNEFYFGSDRGPNYIKIGSKSIYCNSAPYKVIKNYKEYNDNK